MTDLVDRLMRAWTELPDDDAAAEAAFAQLYTSPTLINGQPFTLTDLVTRARSLHRAFAGLHHEVLERVDAPGKLVIAFRMHGVHTGPLQSAVGEIAATGRPIDVRTVDVLTLIDGRVSEVVVVSDELGMLRTLGAIGLPPP